MKTIGVTLLVLCCSGLTSPARADEAQDAVELLKISMQCPLKTQTKVLYDYKLTPDKTHVFKQTTATYVSHAECKYLGDQHRLRIEYLVAGGDHPELPSTNGYAGDYSQLESPTIVAENSFDPDVIDGGAMIVDVKCIGDAKCFDHDYHHGDFTPNFPPMPHAPIRVCDAETAAHVKMAIDILIRLNRSK